MAPIKRSGPDDAPPQPKKRAGGPIVLVPGRIPVPALRAKPTLFRRSSGTTLTSRYLTLELKSKMLGARDGVQCCDAASLAARQTNCELLQREADSDADAPFVYSAIRLKRDKLVVSRRIESRSLK
jgi:hypothetical protein